MDSAFLTGGTGFVGAHCLIRTPGGSALFLLFVLLLQLVADFAIDDFLQRDVRPAHPRTRIDQRAMAGRELPDPFRDDIHEQRHVRNFFRGFLN